MSDNADIVRDGLRCARNDSQLLDGCNIDAASAVLREALIWKVTQG